MSAAEPEVLHWQGEHPLQRMIHGTFGGEDTTLGDGSIQGLDVSPHAHENVCYKMSLLYG